MSDGQRVRDAQQRGTSYRKQVRDPVAPERRVSITAPTEAEAVARAEAVGRVRYEVRAGIRSPREAQNDLRRLADGALKVSDVWQRYVATLSETWAPRARSVWSNQLAPTFGDLLAWDIDDAAIRGWELAMQKRGYAATTIRGAYDCLTAAFRLAAYTERIPRVPWSADSPKFQKPGKSTRSKRREDVENNTEREAARDWSEAEALIRAASEFDAEDIAKGRYADLHYRLAVMLLCGLRQGEACALAWDRIEIDGGTPTVLIDTQTVDQWKTKHPEWLRPMTPPKGKKSRRLALARTALMVLRLQRENLRRHGMYEPHGPVFPRYVKDPGRARWRTHAECIRPEVMRRIVERAGLPNVERWVTHSMRHSFATIEAVLSGGDLRSVQRRTGHSDIRTVETYMHAATRGRLTPSFMDRAELSEGVVRAPGEVTARIAAADTSRGRLLVAGDVPDNITPPELRPELKQVLDVFARHARDTDDALHVAEKRRADRRTRAKAKQHERSHRRSQLEPLILAWMAAGSPGLRPPAITAWAERAYDNRLKKELYHGKAPEQAKKAAKFARRSVLAAFAKVQKRLERAAGETASRPRAGEAITSSLDGTAVADPWGLAGSAKASGDE